MPGPDPHSLWIDCDDCKRPVVSFQAYFWTGNNGNRMARATSMLKRLSRGDWFCRWCGDALPDHKRADARFCREACRKAAARWRKDFNARYAKDGGGEL